MPPITRALIPAAGHGTRLRPLTLAIPKEMLPLGRKPVLEYIVEELAVCGIRHVLIVVSPGKPSIGNYFEDGSRFGMAVSYAVQNEMRGLGDAVLYGEEWAAGEPFLVAFGDCIIRSRNHSATRRLLASHEALAPFAGVLTEIVPPEAVTKYGILTPKPVQPLAPFEEFEFDGVIEKPAVACAPSRYAVAARWTLDAGIFEYLRQTPPDAQGELGLAQAVDVGLRSGKSGRAVVLAEEEIRVDIGCMETYMAASVTAIFEDTEYGSRIRDELLSGHC